MGNAHPTCAIAQRALQEVSGLDFHASPGRFGRDLHTSKILRSISDRPRQLIDRVRTLATVLGALRRLARAAILPALHRRKSERRGCPSKSMASGDQRSPSAASGLSGPGAMETTMRELLTCPKRKTPAGQGRGMQVDGLRRGCGLGVRPRTHVIQTRRQGFC